MAFGQYIFANTCIGQCDYSAGFANVRRGDRTGLNACGMGRHARRDEGTDKGAWDLAPLKPFAQENNRRTFKAADDSQMA